MITSAWSPLRYSIFRALWLAALVSNLGTWMHSVGAAWAMTLLSPSAVMVALVQTASSLPMFLLALLAGALADIVDRRRLLLVTQTWMMLAAGALALVTFAGRTTDWVLLVVTFLLGAGGALNGPAWQAIVPELVPSEELAPAIVLNGVNFNLARAVGPALGGLIVALAGPAFNFALNAISFLGVVIVLYRWERPPRDTDAPTEHILGAMRAGLRYMRHWPPLQAVLVQTGVFIFAGSSLWALLPLVAQRELGLDASGYGVLLGLLGVGAVVGAVILPRARERLSLDGRVAVATVLFALVTAAPVYLRNFALFALAMIVGGVAWLIIMSSFSVAAQTSTPKWVEARALALYQLVFQGGFAIGSLFWGAVANTWGIPGALLVAGIALVLGMATMLRFRLTPIESLDFTMSHHWREPHVAIPLEGEEGPVLVSVEYRIDPVRASEFVEAIQELSHQRRRDGATRWELFRDVEKPGRYVETFYVESWAEHLRQHERVLAADRAVEDRVNSFQLDGREPRTTHLVAEREPVRSS